VTWCLVIVGVILLAIAAGCRVAYLESKDMPIHVDRTLQTKCDERSSMILQAIPHALDGLSSGQILKFMYLMQQAQKLPDERSDLTADHVFAMCAMAGYAIATDVKSAIQKKESEIVSGN